MAVGWADFGVLGACGEIEVSEAELGGDGVEEEDGRWP